jgi:hypothetical protein
MNNLTYQNFADHLRTAVPGFDRVYDEHLADNDDILPHVLLGDLVRFLSREVEVHGDESVTLKQAMRLLESGMGSADARLQELVAVSFLENLDPADASFRTISELFGPKLEQQYRQYANATASGVKPV